MRVNSCKLALFVAFSLLMPAAFARTHLAAAKPHRAIIQQTKSSHPAKPNKRNGKYSSLARHRKAAATPTEPVHLGHNRRRHRIADTALTQSNVRYTGESALVAKPVSVISLIRKTSEKPQLLPIEEQVITPVILPSLFTRRGHLIMPHPLKGSRLILLHQNEMADRDGLDRIQDDNDLRRMRTSKTLVPVPASVAIQTDERLPLNRRYCRPWTARFLVVLAKAHYARFRSPLQVNSAVRTVEFQQKLLQTNGNAAPAEGETASPHLTGQAIDLAKHGLTLTEIAWLRGYLLPLVQEGKIDVEEEFQQSCFHVSVYRNYIPSPATKGKPAQMRRSPDSSLRAALR